MAREDPGRGLSKTDILRNFALEFRAKGRGAYRSKHLTEPGAKEEEKTGGKYVLQVFQFHIASKTGAAKEDQAFAGELARLASMTQLLSSFTCKDEKGRDREYIMRRHETSFFGDNRQAKGRLTGPPAVL